MTEAQRERIGVALRRMASDLVAERKRATLLARENRELRLRVERLQRQLDGDRTRSGRATMPPHPQTATGSHSPDR